jgi:hypothetical protein
MFLVFICVSNLHGSICQPNLVWLFGYFKFLWWTSFIKLRITINCQKSCNKFHVLIIFFLIFICILSVGLGNVSNIWNRFGQVPKPKLQNLQQTILIKSIYGLQLYVQCGLGNLSWNWSGNFNCTKFLWWTKCFTKITWPTNHLDHPCLIFICISSVGLRNVSWTWFN